MEATLCGDITDIGVAGESICGEQMLFILIGWFIEELTLAVSDGDIKPAIAAGNAAMLADSLALESISFLSFSLKY